MAGYYFHPTESAVLQSLPCSKKQQCLRQAVFLDIANFKLRFGRTVPMAAKSWAFTISGFNLRQGVLFNFIS